MKTLYLVRHAKSSWKDNSLTDIDRPLNKRGVRDAPQMGQRLAKDRVYPGIIVSSPAKRALQTAGLLATEMNYKSSAIVIEEAIYEASPNDLLRVIRSFPDRVACVMLVGHNPGMTTLVNRLTRSDIDNIPTCGIALLRFSTTFWKKLTYGKAELLDFDYPKREEE